MARLTTEEKALLARMLEAEDDDTEEDVEEAPEADEFTYQGKRYVYTPDELEEVQEEEPGVTARPAPKVRKPSGAPAAKPKPAPKPEQDAAPPAGAARRFHT